MPVYHNIHPPLDMILFVCQGAVTGLDLFQAADIVREEAQFHYGMLVVLDLFSASDRFELDDIKTTINRLNQTVADGHDLARIVVLSGNPGIHLLVEMINLLPSETQLSLKSCSTLEDAIDFLGLGASKRKIIRFWKETRAAIGLSAADALFV